MVHLFIRILQCNTRIGRPWFFWLVRLTQCKALRFLFHGSDRKLQFLFGTFYLVFQQVKSGLEPLERLPFGVAVEAGHPEVAALRGGDVPQRSRRVTIAKSVQIGSAILDADKGGAQAGEGVLSMRHACLGAEGVVAPAVLHSIIHVKFYLNASPQTNIIICLAKQVPIWPTL